MLSFKQGMSQYMFDRPQTSADTSCEAAKQINVRIPDNAIFESK